MNYIKRHFVAIILCFVIVLLLLLTPLFLIKEETLPVRSINVSDIALSLDEKIEKVKDKFDFIETSTEGNQSFFNAKINFEEIDLMSTEYEGQDVEANYEAVINYSEDEFIVKRQIEENGDVTDETEVAYKTQYNENSEKFYLIDTYGNKIDIVKEIEQESVEECFVISLSAGFAALFAALAALLVVPPLIESLPDISNALAQLTSGIVDGARNFWDSLKLVFGGITAIELPNTIAFTESLAEKLYKEAEKRIDYYLLCGPVGSNSHVPIKYKFTCKLNAANWIKKGGSVWSPYSNSAKDAIKTAGYLAGGKKGTSYVINAVDYHVNNKIATFNHYHALTKNLKKIGSIHSFYGVPY